MEQLESALKRRDEKAKAKKAQAGTDYRISKKLDMLVGDDTGLLKKVKINYSYQTEIYGYKPNKFRRNGGDQENGGSDDD